MEPTLHPLAPHHLPSFITAAGDTDVLLVLATISLIGLILFLGLLYFKLHALPEKMAHRNPNKMQFEIVAVLSLLALFTHNTNFWFAALILAMIRFPDYQTPLETIAAGVTRMVRGNAAAPPPPPPPTDLAFEPATQQPEQKV